MTEGNNDKGSDDSGGEDDKGRKRQEDEKARKGPAMLEWIAAAAGGAITLGLAALLLTEALRPSAPAPIVAIAVESVLHEGSGYIVEVEVSNRSGATAAALTIEGELRRAGVTIETGTATLGYLPGNSTRKAGLIFTRDPRQFELGLRATGYEAP